MKSSFNAFGKTKKEFGAMHVPVWLGHHVPRVPGGFTLDRSYLAAGLLIPAGTPIHYDDATKVFSPVLAYDVVKVESGVVTVNGSMFGVAPAVGAYARKVSASNFASNGSAAAITAVSVNASNPDHIDVSVAIDGLKAGDVVAFTPSSSTIPAPNAYLFNDVYMGDIDVNDETAAATGAAVVFNPDGLMIDRTPGAGFKEALLKLIPGVLLKSNV